MVIKFCTKSKLFKAALAVLLCVLIISQAFIQAYGADNDSAESGYCSYQWTLIDSEDALRKYIEPGASNQDAGRMFITEKGNRDINDNDINNWFKVLIAYKIDDREYIFSGSQMAEGGEAFAASRVLPTYFYDNQGNAQHIGDKVLNSTSGLYAPYIKYQGEQNEDPRVFVRFAASDGPGKETLGSDVMIGNLSWYGVAHHAFAYAEFVKTSAAGPKGRDASGSCSHTEFWEHIIKFGSGGKFQAYFSTSGSGDRYWTYDHKDYRVEFTQKPDYNKSSFYLYFGVPTPGRVIDQSMVAESMTTTYNTAIISENALLEIPKGSCVVLDGFCKVNGSILVNGGTLIVRGTVDTTASIDVQNKALNEAAAPGSIRLTNGGALYVEDTGVLCLRLATSSLVVENGSTARIDGGCLVAGKIKITDSSFVVSKGAALLHGFTIPELVSAQALGRAGIAENKDKTLDYYVSNDLSTGESYIYYLSVQQGWLEVGNKGVFYAWGLYCRNPLWTWEAAFAENAVIRAETRTNYHAKISDMMWQW